MLEAYPGGLPLDDFPLSTLKTMLKVCQTFMANMS